MTAQTDVIVVGAGLAGLVATYELTRAGRSVLVLEQENADNLGGQAHWSLGGIFLVNSPEQRRLGVRDSAELALRDWMGSAAFGDSASDRWPRRWAEAYVSFAAGEKREYLRGLGMRFMPFVGWAERGDGTAGGHGNSVPRFHFGWGTGPEIVRVFAERVRRAEREGLVRFEYRRRVDELLVDRGAVHGVRGSVLEPSAEPRGVASSRRVVGEFEHHAQAVVVASGGIGGDQELVRRNWPRRLGRAPEHMLTGVPAHVDGRMLEIGERAGASVINRDRMWHYTEGVGNWDPVWPDHGIRILPGPSSLWLDACGNRLPPPYFPGFDTMGTLRHLLATGHDHSWFLLDRSILEKEFALSGSEQNPDLTDKSPRKLLSRVRGGAPGPVEAFRRRGVDFLVRDTLRDLVTAMNELTGRRLLDYQRVRDEVLARDAGVGGMAGKDMQLTAIRAARGFVSDRLIRVTPPHRLLDPRHGPLVAVRLRVLTRKTLGGMETNLDSQVLRPDGGVVDGLYAAGEVAGFGGGGVHGHNALEGTFLGGCVFSGRNAGRALARDLG
ncbi:FAD-binding dehydrogenase [Actinopolyspora mortivallis]|uniref:FAD-binding dehydrogenase n=1 Tax=Actinopolyspora mortivallis TaxID=33906 RepID=A0A2T0GT35_ACTMO|nr:FAD-binding dehydrogenase [Actinopolyspora mortivallis]PRW62260.1 FAD-binding dehydrogenase [Actinopolyspora mortivallis]